jgi:Zn-finger nucleic acid-binding protein
MPEQTLDGRNSRPVTINLCHPCQAFWFDTHESLSLTPGSTLALFRIIGEHSAQSVAPGTATPTCPRCTARLQRIHDMQRTTRFEYLKCPKGHGRLTTFFNFLREKDFIRPLTTAQIAELRRNVQTVNCANCGGPVDLSQGGTCDHCHSPLSMLDMKQAGAMVTQLREAERDKDRIDPALPLDLVRARREVDLAFRGLDKDDSWIRDNSTGDLVSAGLKFVARWLERKA